MIWCAIVVNALEHLSRPGFNYSKAEVLLNLCQPDEYTDDLFAIAQPAEATKVMAVLDQINGRWGIRKAPDRCDTQLFPKPTRSCGEFGRAVNFRTIAKVTGAPKRLDQRHARPPCGELTCPVH